MEIVVKGRHTEVSEGLRRHIADTLSKVERYDTKVIRIDVELSHERNPRQSDVCERVELTCHSKGPVIRAEACAADVHAALDLAQAKLEGRLRKAADRRRVHHGNRTPVSLAAATAVPPATAQGENPTESGEAAVAGAGAAAGDNTLIHVDGDGPLVIREKVHDAVPMSLDQALYEMELVGHDFFLFVDSRDLRPSVVYRRRGYDYGVIRLDVQQIGEGAAAAEVLGVVGRENGAAPAAARPASGTPDEPQQQATVTPLTAQRVDEMVS